MFSLRSMEPRKKLSFDELFEACPPSRTLSSTYSQYENEIDSLERRRAGEDIPRLKHRGGDDLAAYVQASLTSDRNTASFSPFELLTKIHKTVIEKIPYTDREIVFEESAPVHYGPIGREGSFSVKSTRLAATGGDIPDLNRDYQNAVVKALSEHADNLNRQKLTVSDVILINRRLIERNLRCIPCMNRSVTCFRYDWISRELL